jgi:hypothetical protein
MKQTVVEWLLDELNQIKSSSTDMNGTIKFLETEFKELFEQAKEMEEQETLLQIANRKLMSNDWLNGAEFGAKWKEEQILDFLYEEITERRDYSASKMCENVIEFIEKFKNK